MKRTLLALGLVIASTGAAFAYGPSTPDVDYRQHNQNMRIYQGMRDGSLTRWEARGLVEQQRRIQAYESFARADGYISPEERRTLARMQSEASRNIYHQRHDFDRRPTWPRWYGYGWR